MSTAIQEYSKTDAALADLESRYKGVVFDVATRDGMLAAIKGRAELRGYRVSLEKTRVEIKAPALERSRLIDTEAKRIKDALAALEDPIDEAIKSEETRKERERAEKEAAELARVTGIQEAIARYGQIAASMVGKPSGEIAAALAEMRKVFVGEWAFEFKAAAQEAHAKAVATLEQLHAGALAQEQAAAAEAERVRQEREELARLRAEQQERDRTEQARIAEETRKRAEEAAAARAKIEAEERASREKIEAENRRAREIREEADRVAREALAAQEARLKAEREAEEAKQRARRQEEERAWAEKQAADKAKRDAEEAEAARQADAQAREAARLKAESDALEAARKEVEARQQEVLQTDRLIGVLRERIGTEKRYDGIAKAIDAYLANPPQSKSQLKRIAAQQGDAA